VAAVAGYVIVSLQAFHPHHRAVACGLFVVGAVMLIVAIREKRHRMRRQQVMLRRAWRAYFPHIIIAVILLVGGRAAWVLVPVEPSPLVDMTDEQLRAGITQDVEHLDVLAHNLGHLLDNLREAELPKGSIDSLSLEKREQLVQTWQDYVLLSSEYDRIKNFYKGFYQLDYVARPELHVDAFIVAMSAFLDQYLAAMELTATIAGHPSVETLLNDATDLFPAKTYFAMKQNLTHPDTLLRLNAGFAYFKLVRGSASLEATRLDALEDDLRTAFKKLGKSPRLFARNPIEFLETATIRTWYPIQKNVAIQLSLMRTTGRDYFIKKSDLASSRSLLEPADILVERRNWHMTNVGIPGFWPHAALYVGRYEDLDAYFADARSAEGPAPSEMISERFPDATKAWRSTGEEGYAMTVLEAIKPGVVFQSFEHSGHADYLGVMRPRLTRKEKLDVILAALAHWQKPYDYNFDFSTDSALVCSELVCKSLARTAGFTVKPRLVNGRPLFTPNELVQKFDEEFGEPVQQLDFVLYLQGREDTGEVVSRERIDFRRSWKLPKWDVLQE